MRKLLKKMIAPAFMVAAMSLAISMNCNNADAAAKANSSKDFKYTKVKNGLEITKYKGTGKKVIIPEKINGKKVVGIGKYSFCKNDTITSVNIPDTVKYIKKGSFQSCKKLKRVKLSKKLETIEYSAFENSGITGVKIPDGVKKLGISAFKDCVNLKSVQLNDTIKVISTECFSGDKKLESINLDNIESIKVLAFKDAESLSGSLDLSNVYNVDSKAFYRCSKITEVIFSDRLQQLGYGNIPQALLPGMESIPGSLNKNPFAYCASIEKFVIPAENVNYSVIDGAIYGKTGEWLIAYPAAKTGQLAIDAKVKGISEYAFSSSAHSSILMDKGINIIGAEAFAESKINEVKLPMPDCDVEPNWIKPVWDYTAFMNCKELNRVIWPQDIRSTYNMAFLNCTALKEMVLPDTLENMSRYMFFGCSSLESMRIPGKITRIPGACFYGCQSLKGVNLDNITEIGAYAFKDCQSLTGTLTLKADNVEAYAFEGCTNISNVVFTEPVRSLGGGANDGDNIGFTLSEFTNDYNTPGLSGTFSNPFGGCTKLESYTMPQGGNAIVVDGVVYSKDMKELIACPQAKTGKFNVPYGVECISQYAFDGAAVNEIVTSNSVTEIGNSAIINCGVQRITLSKSVEIIYDINERLYGFKGCDKLEEINVNSGNKYYYSKDGVLYEKGKEKMLSCYPPAKKGSIFKVPKNVYPAKAAFIGCKYLKKVIIPEGIKICTYEIFSKCSGIKLYLPKSVSKCESVYVTDGSKLNYAFGEECSKCRIMIKKGSKLAKDFNKNKVKYGLY